MQSTAVTCGHWVWCGLGDLMIFFPMAAVLGTLHDKFQQLSESAKNIQLPEHLRQVVVHCGTFRCLCVQARLVFEEV